MPLAAGARLGPYEIQSALGAGGMGEVYRARDPRLGRAVAVKVLPAAFSADPDRLRRFEQEARAAAALNHPNILTVHEIGTHDDQPYIVSELLEGQTLRDELGHGGLPVKKAVDYAVAICRGLGAAHERGIVHRDLKPENVFVTTDGRVKILDFGLAKLTEPAAAGRDVTSGATMTAAHAADTIPGLVLGTVGYMSPEQARGQPVDHRSDIFSFGSMLYEMLSGARAFAGDTPADTISAILGADPPDLTTGRGTIASGLERIVRHCLEKRPADRFQSAADIAFGLETATVSLDPPVPDPRTSERRGRTTAPLVLMVTAVVAAVTGAAAMWWLARRGAPAPAAVTLADVARLTHDVGFSEWPTWAPDGNSFAFSSSREGNFEIYVRRVEGGEDVNITKDPADDVQPEFSPLGTEIAFVSTRSSRTRLIKTTSNASGSDTRTYGGDIWVTPALGGHARRVAEDGNFPVWRPDGRAIAYVSGPESHRAILEVAADGGVPKPLLPSAASRWEITRLRYAPDGRWLTFETTDEQVLTLSNSGGPPQELLRGSHLVWASNGRRVYYIDPGPNGGTRLLWADITEHQGRLSATPAPIGWVTGTLQDLALAPNGRRLLASERQESVNLTRLPLAPDGGSPAGPEEELSTSGQVRDGYPEVSPDGGRVLLQSDRLRGMDLWILTLASHSWDRVQLRQKPCEGYRGSWASDRQLVVTCSMPDRTFSVWSVLLDGSESRELVSGKPGPGPGNAHGEFSSDGKSLLYEYVKDGFYQMFVRDVSSGGERQLTTSPCDKYDGHWSGDGRWIVYASNAGGSVQAWKVSAQGGEEHELTRGAERWRHNFFSPDGRWIYVQPSHRNIYRVPAEGGLAPPQQVTHFPESGLFIEEPTISPDGKYLVYSRSRGGSSLWLLTLGPPGAAAADQSR